MTTTSSQTRNTGITNKSAEGRRPPKPNLPYPTVAAVNVEQIKQNNTDTSMTASVV